LITYKCRLLLESPTIIASRRTDRGIFTEIRYIPASTIGGSLNNQIVEDLGDRPKIICSPAYPVTENGGVALPAHPFVYECKGPEKCRFSTLREVENNALCRREDVKKKLVKLMCEKRNLVKSLHPKLVNICGGVINEANLHYLSLVSVGINKVTASSDIGVLYEYEAFTQGVSFLFYSTVIDDSINLKEYKDLVIKIGRGISRGFGRAKIIDVQEVNLRDEEEKLRHEGVFPMYAISPILLNKNNGVLTNRPEEKINLEKYAKILSIKEEIDGELAPYWEEANFYGSFSTYSMGWNKKLNRPRPHATCMNPGSIILFKWGAQPSNDSLSMVYLKYVGIPVKLGNGDSYYGLNMLSPFNNEPLEEVWKT